MSIADETILFDWRISVITAQASAISGYAWLFDHQGSFDTALEKMDLRRSVTMLREAADRLENIEQQIRGTETAFAEAAE